jgi:hypothetical protein
MASTDPIEALWKPGERKPKITPRQHNNNKGSSPSPPSAKTPQSSSSSTTDSKKKKLSGSTMNMRFMKRKLETNQYQEQQRKQQKSISGQSPAAAQQSTPTSQTADVVIPGQNHTHDGRSIDDTDVPMDIVQDQSGFLKATPTDMYGMLANLLGRRSFGGFNPAVEEAWKSSKNFIDDTNPEKKQSHISDEELVRRYQELSKNRQQDRPVGNLKNRGNNKRRR